MREIANKLDRIQAIANETDCANNNAISEVNEAEEATGGKTGANELTETQSTIEEPINSQIGDNQTTTSDTMGEKLERININNSSEGTAPNCQQSALVSIISSVENLPSANLPRSRASMLRQQESTVRHRLACHHCGEEHTMFGCPDYRNMSLQTRWMRVRELSLCANCLSPNHRAGSLSCKGGDCGNCPQQLHNSSLCPILNAMHRLPQTPEI